MDNQAALAEAEGESRPGPGRLAAHGERAIHEALTRLSARVPIDRFANDIVVVAERRVPRE